MHTEKNMALRNLTVEEMVALSAGWVGAGNAAHRLLKSHTRLVALLPDLERVHNAIYSVTPQLLDPRKAELSQRAVALDARHDQIVRGIYGVLTAYAPLAEDASESLELRDALIPGGLSAVTQISFRGQAGYASLLRDRLTPELRKRLKAFSLPKGSLLDRVETWLETAQKLGELEEERARIEASEGPSLGRQTVEARNLWIRVVNAFLSLAALADLDSKDDLILLGPLRDAEARADARSLRRKTGAEPTPAVVPVPAKQDVWEALVE